MSILKNLAAQGLVPQYVQDVLNLANYTFIGILYFGNGK